MAENQNEVKYYADLLKSLGKTNLTLSLDKITAFLDDGKEACQSVWITAKYLVQHHRGNYQLSRRKCSLVQEL